MDTRDLKIARLEREQKRLVRTIADLNDNLDMLLPYTNVDAIPEKDMIVFMQRQKNVVTVMSGIIYGV